MASPQASSSELHLVHVPFRRTHKLRKVLASSGELALASFP